MLGNDHVTLVQRQKLLCPPLEAEDFRGRHFRQCRLRSHILAASGRRETS